MPVQDSIPARHRDGTLTAIVETANEPLPGGTGMRVRVAAGSLGKPSAGSVAGRYVLARCGALDKGALSEPSERMQQWTFPLRRPLWLTGVRRGTSDGEHETWSLLLPGDPLVSDHPADGWLRQLRPGAAVNLMGPLGNGFGLRPGSRNLLLLADGAARSAGIAPLLALIDERLDDGGRVTLVVKNPSPVPSQLKREPLKSHVRAADTNLAQAETANIINIGAWLRAQLPLAVELHLVADEEWAGQVETSLAWADQLCAALPMTAYRPLGEAIKAKRFLWRRASPRGWCRRIWPVAWGRAWPASCRSGEGDGRALACTGRCWIWCG